MHELTVTENMLQLALRHGRDANAARITDLYLVIGEFSSFVDESVQFYWDLISRNTMAENAHLHFRRVPARMLCLHCHQSFSPTAGLLCPHCAGNELKITAGEEFYLEAIDIEEAEEVPL